MGLELIRQFFARLRTFLCSVLQQTPSVRFPSDDSSPSSPQALSGPWDEGWALDIYSRRVGATFQLTETGLLVLKYKYRGRIDSADCFADRVIALMEQRWTVKTIDGIVTVPLSAQRSYDPVSLLGQVLARRLGVPLLSGCLQKTRTTNPQKDMRARAQKRANVAGAFAVRGDVRGRSLLALDDLYDSGETLREVTRVLKRAGARWVGVITLTRTRWGERS